ncbi:MAG: PD40 domain-containing protein, partial [Flavobacteriales bacterium]|nr:PD40 domain-containing protein [Flavobacteriales bacterium]
MSTSIRGKGIFNKIALLIVVVFHLSSIEAWAQGDTTIVSDSISADSLEQLIIKGFITEDIRTGRSVPKEAEPYVRRGERFFYQGPEKYDKAIEQFILALKVSPNSAYVNFKIGECYLLGNKDKIKSIPYLEKAFHQNKKIDKRILFLLGRSLHLNMDLELAIEEYEKYIEFYRKENRFTDDMPADSTILDVQRKISECRVAIELIQEPERVFVYNLGPNVNSPFPDYDPFLTSNDTILIFTSRRENTKGGGRADVDAEFFEDVYEAHKYAEGWRPAQSMSRKFNKRTNNAIVGISGDGLKIFMYRDIEGGNIYLTKMIDGKWSKPKSIKAINTEFHETSACLSNDERTLYFVSNRPGGLGGHDIYTSTLNDEGEWGEPENMGPLINTEYDEGRVFMHRDGQTLYFSSKGHRTMGGYDIFMTNLDSNGAWSTPENIGYPINTVDDDISFSVTPNKSRGYYASIKPNGIGSKDIYMVVFLDFLKPEPMVNQEVRVIPDSIHTTALLPRKALEEPIDSSIAQIDSSKIKEVEALANLEFLQADLLDFNPDSANADEKIENLEAKAVVNEIELELLGAKLERATDSVDMASLVSQINVKEEVLLDLKEQVSDIHAEEDLAAAIAAADPVTKILNLNAQVSSQRMEVENLNTLLANTTDSVSRDSLQALVAEKELNVRSLKEEIATVEAAIQPIDTMVSVTPRDTLSVALNTLNLSTKVGADTGIETANSEKVAESAKINELSLKANTTSQQIAALNTALKQTTDSAVIHSLSEQIADKQHSYDSLTNEIEKETKVIIAEVLAAKSEQREAKIEELNTQVAARDNLVTELETKLENTSDAEEIKQLTEQREVAKAEQAVIVEQVA